MPTLYRSTTVFFVKAPRSAGCLPMYSGMRNSDRSGMQFYSAFCFRPTNNSPFCRHFTPENLLCENFPYEKIIAQRISKNNPFANRFIQIYPLHRFSDDFAPGIEICHKIHVRQLYNTKISGIFVSGVFRFLSIWDFSVPRRSY